jgi:hypothetical protein
VALYALEHATKEFGFFFQKIDSTNPCIFVHLKRSSIGIGILNLSYESNRGSSLQGGWYNR